MAETSVFLFDLSPNKMSQAMSFCNLSTLGTHFSDEPNFFSGTVKSKKNKQWEELITLGRQIEKQCRQIARLTAVDGALVMNLGLSVYCFGAKIIPGEDQLAPPYIQTYRPIEGDIGVPVRLTGIGGTRHQSAALFAHANPHSVAIVTSQDGNVTFFTTDAQSEELIAIQQSELAVLQDGLSSEFLELFNLCRQDNPALDGIE